MKNRTYFILAGGGIAAYLLWTNRKEASENEDFQKGYAAGFFTPGPFTVMAITGLVAWHA